MAAESEDDEEDQSRAEEAVFAALDLLGLQAVHGSGHTYLHYTRTAPHRTAPLYAGNAYRRGPDQRRLQGGDFGSRAPSMRSGCGES